MHQIQRHLLTIDCSSSSFGKEVQLVVADLMEKEFYPKLEELLDQYPMVDATWIIDKIQITIPSVSKKDWKNDLVTNALSQIEAFLNENFKDINTINNSGNATSLTTLIPNPQQAEFLFLDYLKTGYFNKSALYNTVLDIEKQLAASTFTNEARKLTFFKELVNVLLENPKSLIRFIYTVSSQTKTSIRNEKIGFLFDIAAILKNEKPDKKFFSSSDEYTNWISLLEWSLYFFKTNASSDVIDRFAASSSLNFQLNAIEINRFLEFLIQISAGKLTNELQNIVLLFGEKMKSYAVTESNFKTVTANEVTFKKEAVDEINFKTEADTSLKPKAIEKQTSLKKLEIEKKLHEAASKMDNSLSEANGIANSVSDDNKNNALDKAIDKENNPLNSLANKDKRNPKDANDETIIDTKPDNSELLQNVDGNPNPLNTVEREVQNSNSSDDAIPFNTTLSNTSETVDVSFDYKSELKNASKILIESDKHNDNEHIKLRYRRFNLEEEEEEKEKEEEKENEEDTNAISTTAEETFQSSKLTIENPIYIENAGLVILHPLLIHLFEQLKLCKSEEWTSKRNQHKAVLISQYLITGSTIFFENDLMLNKIVCGLEPDAVIDVAIKLSAKECKEAKGLLEAVIGYWKALNNSSIDALRETFLQRNGKLLFKNETDIELWVEQKGFDVLMSQIPWGIGMIKTPWMNRFIDCHWN